MPSNNRSTEGCSKLKNPETIQSHERLVSTLEDLQVPKWDRTRCPEELASPVGAKCQIIKHHVSFSDPNGVHLPTWPLYNYENFVQILDTNVEARSDTLSERREFWLEDIYSSDAIIRTAMGVVNGDVKRVPGAGKMFTFRKIPYAKPPVNQLRFRKPEPYGSWSGILDGTAFGPSCIQNPNYISPGLPNTEMSEDCLHLNIYVPYELTATPKRSVMVWVHGGGYEVGQSFSYDGTSLALRGDVIVVTFNYRLGVFGFLRTDDLGSKGNFGLWDQHMAFKWVYDNIQAFGGNPNSVTIFGESAGGGSVSFQSLYPGNQGLFQRLISQSGVATSQGMRIGNAKQRHWQSI